MHRPIGRPVPEVPGICQLGIEPPVQGLDDARARQIFTHVRRGVDGPLVGGAFTVARIDMAGYATVQVGVY